MILDDFLVLITLGLFVGILSAFFGIGGGIIMVPAIAVIFPSLNQQYVLASSLGVIFINSIINTYNLSRGLLLDWKIINPIAISSIIFSFLTTQYAQQISSSSLKLIFALFSLFVSVWIFKGNTAPKDKAKKNNLLLISSIGFFSGLISGLTGVGGGLVVIPLLLKLTNVSIKSVSVYSNAIMIFTAFSGVVSFAIGKPKMTTEFYSIGYILPALIAIVLIGSFIGSKIGATINQKVNSSTYRIALSLLVFIIAIKMLLSII